MAIIKENNGTYTLHYTKYDVVKNVSVRTKKRGFKTLKEAKDFERSLSRNASDVTFYALYKELQRNTIQEGDTEKGKDSIINRYLPSLLTISYSQLTKPFLISLHTEIARKDLAPKTKNKILDVITSTCKYANKFYDLPDNSKVLDRFKIVKKEFDIWNVDEFNKFIDALKPEFEDCIPFFVAIFNTGMRKGEARALLVEDLDIDNGYITINKSIRKNAKSLKAPKTPSSNRKIKLDKNTLEIIKPLKSHEKWLFGDYKPISRDRIDRAMKYGIEKSGVKPIRIHDLRHSHASILISNGANIVAVSRRLGHSSINMTLSTYAHLLENSDEKIVEIIECCQNVATKTEKAH